MNIHCTELHGASLKGTFTQGPPRPALSMAAHLGELAASLRIAAEEGRGLRKRGDWRRRIFTSWDCPQDRVPELAPALGTASPSSARTRTRVPAALRAAGRRARTRLPSPAPAGLASLRRARSATPRARRLPALALRLPAPPHPPLRRARWEPLAEARGTATDLRRPGSDAGAWSQPGGGVGSAHPLSSGRTPPPPPPAHLRHAHLPPVLGVLAVPTAPQATRACVCGAKGGGGGRGERKAGRKNTHANARRESAWTNDPAGYLFPIASPKSVRTGHCLGVAASPLGTGCIRYSPTCPPRDMGLATPGDIILTWFKPPVVPSPTFKFFFLTI